MYSAHRPAITAALSVAVLVLCLWAHPAWAEHGAAASKPAASKTAAYFEAGNYWEFTLIYEQTLAALKKRGLLESISFPKALHRSPGWDVPASDYRREARELMQNPSVDIILSMGTAATKALLAENNGKTPIISIDVADPVGAGFVNPVTGASVVPNLTIQYVKDKWYKVFALFHEAMPFKRMGIMYHNSPEGLAYSNISEAREVARERGFTLVEYSHLDQAESIETCTKGIDNLLNQNIDAFYISALNCFDWTQNNPQPMFDALARKSVKTFARDGSVHVRRGALMGLSTLDYAPLGKFYADRIAHQLGLLPLGSATEKESYTPKVTLNIVTARSLGIDPPILLLISADEIFDSTLAGMHNGTVAR